MTAVIAGFMLQKVMQAGDSEQSLFLLAISTCPFYYVLLEQLYTGEMNFPPIGVDEGSVLYLFLCLVSGFFGSQELWLETKSSLFGLLSEPDSLRNIACWILPRCLIFYAIMAMVNIYLKRENA